MRPPDYLPIKVIFNLLCVCRRIESPKARSLRQAMRRRGLYIGDFDDIPRLDFWVRLCQSAALLDEGKPPRPTLQAPDWLSWPLGEQLAHLVDGWMRAPTTSDLLRLRQKLPGYLLNNEPMGPKAKHELLGLQSLGLCEEERLTPTGYFLLTGQGDQIVASRPSPWVLDNSQLYVSFPPDWAQLWQLETYLDPASPGVYPLTPKALRLAAQRGAVEGRPSLQAILKIGLGSPPPQGLLADLAGQPTLRVLPGPVLAFTDAQELLWLRKSRSWRKELGQVLSPRHVHLDPWRAPTLLRRLHRRGLLAEKDLELPISSTALRVCAECNGAIGSLTTLSKADRSYLLASLLLTEGLDIPMAAPPGLFSKLVANLDSSLRASAARKATSALESLFPRPQWIPEEEPPAMPEDELIALLEEAIRKQQPIDIFYQKTSQYQPEHRRVTPLFVEQRGLRFYLIAYCHKRRANRTFRLDRLQLLDEPPMP